MSLNIQAISSYLTERKERLKPEEANKLNLKRIGKIDFSGQIHLVENKPTKTNMIIVKKGDLVISGINVAKGALAVYEGNEDVFATIHYSSYIFDKKKIDIKFLKWFLKSPVFVDTLKEQTGGGIKTEIKAKKFLSLKIPLPTVDEQKNIESNLNKFEKKYNQLLGELQKQLELIGKLKGSILNDAIYGKLTDRWRKNKNFNDGVICEYQKNNLHITKEENHPFKIPNTWLWVTLNNLVDQKRGITYGIVKMGKEPVKGIIALRCSDVKFRKIDTTKARKVTVEISNQYRRTVLEGGEILLNIRGTLGGCGIVDSSLKGCNIAREIGMIPMSNKDFTGYILNVLTSPYFNSQIQSNLRGIAYKGLNLNILRNFPIPLPPIEEQKQIVKKVEKLMAKCDALEIEVKKSKIETGKLMQRVLKEAFEK
jgi:type I restriction enzyme S subunit